MAFKGEIKPERWCRILNEVDDFMLRAVWEIMGEDHFGYEFMYRVNCDIPAIFSAILLKVGIRKSEEILLGLLLFKEEFLRLFEIAVGSVDDTLRVPYPEDYGNKGTDIRKRPILELKDETKFAERTPIIRRNVEFLMIWNHIKEPPHNNWWAEYLKEEGFGVPKNLLDIPMERIQVIPSMITKASWVKGNANAKDDAS
ncbi:hypothetical protein SUGI_0635880 [Cryptomeria japonica]|nr:hypothetical protein SUGI_0635880 [Cryptomeria japonica]